MIKFCGWCHERMGEKEPIEIRTITHGCCPDCEDKLLAEDAEDQVLTEDSKARNRREAAEERYDEEIMEGGL